MASPKKLSHIVLQTNRRREMIDWYCTVLGAEILYEAERISFVSYDDEHHRVAFLDPGPLAERQPDAAGHDDAVVRAFGTLYRSQKAEFPSGVGEADYERRLAAVLTRIEQRDGPSVRHGAPHDQ